jgi:hypothetical protein
MHAMIPTTLIPCNEPTQVGPSPSPRSPQPIHPPPTTPYKAPKHPRPHPLHPPPHRTRGNKHKPSTHAEGLSSPNLQSPAPLLLLRSRSRVVVPKSHVPDSPSPNPNSSNALDRLHARTPPMDLYLSIRPMRPHRTLLLCDQGRKIPLGLGWRWRGRRG